MRRSSEPRKGTVTAWAPCGKTNGRNGWKRGGSQGSGAAAIGRPRERVLRRVRSTSASAPRPTDACPISVAERSLSAGPFDWIALAAVAFAAVTRRPADQGARRPQARRRRLDRHRRPVHDPPRPQLRDRVRPLLDLGRRGHAAHGRRGHLDGRLLRPLRRAASRAARSRSGSSSAGAPGTSSTASGSATSPTSSTCAGGRRSTSPTRSSSPA